MQIGDRARQSQGRRLRHYWRSFKLEAHQQFSKTEQAIPMAKDNEELLKAINKAMDELKANGKLKKLSIKWIGFDVTQPPEDIVE